MKIYQDLLGDVLENGTLRQNRTGTAARSVFGRSLLHSFSDGFPLLTTKKIRFDIVIGELLWFLRGETNIHSINSGIWNEWADENGSLGPIYGEQWRKQKAVSPDGKSVSVIDQIANIMKILREDPLSRRMLVSSWNPGQNPYMRLLPCHVSFQLYADPQQKQLSILFYQRSADIFLGLPFNFASYAALLHIFARYAQYEPYQIVAHLGDVHLYENHQQQAHEILKREPHPLPNLTLNAPIHGPDDLPRLTVQDFQLSDYRHHPPLSAPVAV